VVASPIELEHSRAARLAAVRAALAGGTLRTAGRMVNSLHPAEIALLLESLPPRQRDLVWELVETDLEGEVLIELTEEVRDGLIVGMDAAELAAATEDLEVDDLADLLAGLPEAVTQQVLKSMDQQDRERLQTVLEYAPDTAGGLMNTDTVTVRPDVTLDVVLRYLRMRGELKERAMAVRPIGFIHEGMVEPTRGRKHASGPEESGIE